MKRSKHGYPLYYIMHSNTGLGTAHMTCIAAGAQPRQLNAADVTDEKPGELHLTSISSTNLTTSNGCKKTYYTHGWQATQDAEATSKLLKMTVKMAKASSCLSTGLVREPSCLSCLVCLSQNNKKKADCNIHFYSEVSLNWHEPHQQSKTAAQPLQGLLRCLAYLLFNRKPS